MQAAQHTGVVGVADSRHAHTIQSSIVPPGSPQPNKHGALGRNSHDSRSGDGDNVISGQGMFAPDTPGIIFLFYLCFFFKVLCLQGVIACQ